MTESAGNPARSADMLECGGVRLDLVRHRAFAGGREVALTPAQFRLLECLLQQPGRTFSREELMRATLRSGTSYVRTIDQHVRALRHKLGMPQFIQAVYRAGYRVAAHRDAAG